MNEELMKQLVEILRDLRAGATPAWQTLVEQRSHYCMTMAGACAIVAIAAMIGAVALVRRLISAAKTPRVRDPQYSHATYMIAADGVEASVTIYAIASALCVIAFCVSTPHAVIYAADGIAPLGRVLEILK